MNSNINLINDIVTIISFLSGGVCSRLALSYLKGLSTDKECLLVFLYRDVIISITWIRSFRVAEVVLRLWNEDGLNEYFSVAISLGTWAAVFYLAVMANFISYLRLRIAQTGIVDPETSCIGHDDSSRIRLVRIFGVVASIIFISLAPIHGIYPNLYYGISKDHEYPPQIILSNVVYKGTVALLFTLSMVMGIVANIVGPIDKLQNLSFINRAKNNIVMVLVVVIILTALGQTFSFYDYQKHWRFIPISVSILQILLPPAIILRSNQLKDHSIRVLKNLYDDLLLLCIYWVPAMSFIFTYSSIYVIFTLIDV